MTKRVAPKAPSSRRKKFEGKGIGKTGGEKENVIGRNIYSVWGNMYSRS